MSEVTEIVVNGCKNKLNSSSCLTHKYKAIEEMPTKLQDDFIYPDLPSKCTWVREKSQQPVQNVHSVRTL
jgi:hypothetical protein